MKNWKHEKAAIVGLAMLTSTCVSAVAEVPSFNLDEATIADVQTAMKTGRLTARRLIEMCLARIEAYDKKGPALNAIITLNPKALAIADELDAKFNRSGPVGPLHGIPVLLKDNVNTETMPTPVARPHGR